MPIELRILSGSRGGQHEQFDKPAIALGRHQTADLRFDPEADLDVSARHAEITRVANGSYRIRDVGSTNGTYVNGRRIVGEETLNDGDVIWLGAEGPQVEVHITTADVAGTAGAIPATVVRTSNQRPSTGERVRVAVRRETTTMRRVLAAAVVVLLGGVATAYWAGHRESRTRVAELLQLLTQSESTAARLQGELSTIGDTTFASALRKQNAALAARVRSTGATATPDELREFLAPQFAKWWLPDRIEFVAEIPKTSVGKFRKIALREQFASEPAATT